MNNISMSTTSLLLYTLPLLVPIIAAYLTRTTNRPTKALNHQLVWGSTRTQLQITTCLVLASQVVVSIWTTISSPAWDYTLIPSIYWISTLAVSLIALYRGLSFGYVTFLCVFPFINSVVVTLLPLFAIPARHGTIQDDVSCALQTILLVIPMFTPRIWIPLRPGGDTHEPSPEQTCTPFSYFVSYQWIEYLIRIATHRDVVVEDLPPLPDYDQASVWKDHILQARRESLLVTILVLMRWDLLAMSSLAIVVSTTQFFSPIAMQQLLRYLEDVDGSSTNPYLWAILILLGPLSWAVSREMYTFVATRVTVRVKAALTQLIYLKVMVMKANDGNEETSTGRISNLMSTDIETITTVRELFLLIVQLPVCTFVSLVLLYRLMGHAALLGFGGLLLTIPIPGFLANSMALYQRAASLATDLRLSVISENLNAIRITKLFGWEVPKTQLIIEMRYNEQEKLWKRNFVAIAIGFVTDLLPSLNMLATFFVFTLVMGYQLTASTAFTAIAYFEILRSQFLWVGYLSRNVIQSQVSIQRIEAFLNNAEEISPAHSESHNQTRFLSVTCAWSKLGQETRFMLKNVNISFGPGLTIVIGPTASGKSSLLMALLGEMSVVSGQIELCRANGIAYVSQSPWLQAATIRQNILFGANFETTRYTKVIKACALEQDLKLLDCADETQIGENGATLSGGQKQRIALARALYSNAQTLLLDDVLSALDAGMGAKIFKSAITGELTRGKTIVLVTHAVGLCTPLADQVVTMNNGYTSIRRKESVLNLHKRAMSDAEAVTIASLAQNTKNALNPTDRQLSNTIRLTKAKVITTHDEKAATGRISRTATLSLLQNFGSAKYLALLLLVQLLYQGLTVCKTLFPGIWADAYESEKEVHVGVYLSVYTILIFGESFMNAVCNAFVYHGNWTAAGRLHGRLLFSVFQAPLSWHDNTPVGRVLNRFSRDIQSLDTTITPWIRMSIDGLLKVTFSAISVATILPLFAIPAAVVGAMGLIIGELYTKAQISVKRLVSVSESPLFCHFGDSIAGIVTIRSFGAQKRFVLETESRIDDHTRPLEVLYTLTRWSQIRADSLGALVAFGAALLALMGKHRDSGLIGFSLATASGFSVTLLNLIRALNEMEVELNSFERIQEYSGLPQEPPDNAAEQVSPSWPRSGDLIVQNLCVKYSPDTPEILKDISFTLKAGEKIGVVGRSGSGKSTLALSLLRLTHHVSGSIVLDGKDIEDVNLSTLRRRITIIPQDPVLFSGTVRTNLDPFGTVSDALLQQALHHSGLDAQSNDAELTATRATTTLDSKVTEAGQNFSQGQRQILALARAIVRNSKLIIMDEATASCDGATDARIQETLRTHVALLLAYVSRYLRASLWSLGGSFSMNDHESMGREYFDSGETL